MASPTSMQRSDTKHFTVIREEVELFSGKRDATVVTVDLWGSWATKEGLSFGDLELPDSVDVLVFTCSKVGDDGMRHDEPEREVEAPNTTITSAATSIMSIGGKVFECPDLPAVGTATATRQSRTAPPCNNNCSGRGGVLPDLTSLGNSVKLVVIDASCGAGVRHIDGKNQFNTKEDRELRYACGSNRSMHLVKVMFPASASFLHVQRLPDGFLADCENLRYVEGWHSHSFPAVETIGTSVLRLVPLLHISPVFCFPQCTFVGSSFCQSSGFEKLDFSRRVFPLVEAIGPQFCASCSDLKSLNLASAFPSATVLGPGAFSYCSRLEELRLENAFPNLASESLKRHRSMMNIRNTTVDQARKTTSKNQGLILPSLSPNTFSKMRKLETVYLSDATNPLLRKRIQAILEAADALRQPPQQLMVLSVPLPWRWEFHAYFHNKLRGVVLGLFSRFQYRVDKTTKSIHRKDITVDDDEEKEEEELRYIPSEIAYHIATYLHQYDWFGTSAPEVALV